MISFSHGFNKIPNFGLVDIMDPSAPMPPTVDVTGASVVDVFPDGSHVVSPSTVSRLDAGAAAGLAQSQSNTLWIPGNPVDGVAHAVVYIGVPLCALQAIAGKGGIISKVLSAALGVGLLYLHVNGVIAPSQGSSS